LIQLLEGLLDRALKKKLQNYFTFATIVLNGILNEAENNDLE
jgi:hypothetical protein